LPGGRSSGGGASNVVPELTLVALPDAPARVEALRTTTPHTFAVVTRRARV